MTGDEVLRGITVLLVCQLVGEAVARVLELDIPGPVIGLVLLFVVLRLREGRPPAGVEPVADGILRHLAMLFVPAGVGVIRYGSLLREEWPTLVVTILGVTVLGLGVTAGIMVLLIRRAAGRSGAHHG